MWTTSKMSVKGIAGRLICLVLALILLLVSVGFAEEDKDEETQEEKIRRLAEQSYDRFVTILGRDYYYYAQNNPVFMRTRIKGNHTVSGSSCAPTVLANIIINTLNIDNIEKIRDITYKGIRIDTVNVLTSRGYKIEYKFEIKETADLIQFLPVCIINIVADNNTCGFKEYRSTGYYARMLKTLGLEYKKLKSVDECLEALRNHDCMIETCTGGRYSPIANQAGHYLVMADIDDEYVYFLDSNVREDYPLDKKGIIEILEPGVFRCRIENIKKLYLTGTKYLVYRQENTYPETQKKD